MVNYWFPVHLLVNLCLYYSIKSPGAVHYYQCALFIPKLLLSPFICFRVNFISTTPNKWTPAKTTWPVGPHQDSGGTLLLPDMVTPLVTTSDSNPAYTHHTILEQWSPKTGMALYHLSRPCWRTSLPPLPTHPRCHLDQPLHCPLRHFSLLEPK